MRGRPKLIELLSTRERFGVLSLLLLVLIGSLLEIVSLGAVVPALLSVIAEDGDTGIPLISEIQTRLSLSNGALYLALIGVFLFKNVLVMFSVFVQSAFAAHLMGRLTEDLYGRYLRQPYEFHLSNNSADLIRKVQTAGIVWTSGVGSWLNLIADVVVAIGLLVLMFFQEPIGTLVAVGAFGSAGVAVSVLTRGPLERWGEMRHENEAQLLRSAQHGLGSIREAKVLSIEDALDAELRGFSRRSHKLVSRAVTAQSAPRAVVEVAGVITLVVVLVILRSSDVDTGKIVVTLGLFAAVSFRIIPSVNRIVGSLQSLALGRSQIRTIRLDLELNSSATKLMELDLKQIESIRLDRVSFKYPTSAVEILNDVNLNIRRGESIGIIGPSGAGKSSLLDVVLGLFHPNSGQVLINEQLVDSREERWTSLFGYVPQSVFLFDDTILKNVTLGRNPGPASVERVREALDAAALLEYVESLPSGIETQIGEHGLRMSGGQRQRLGIARALYSDPDILILDEATSSLDVETESEVMRSIEALKGIKTVIIVTHRLTTVQACDRLYRMELGRLTELHSNSDV